MYTVSTGLWMLLGVDHNVREGLPAHGTAHEVLQAIRVAHTDTQADWLPTHLSAAVWRPIWLLGRFAHVWSGRAAHDYFFCKDEYDHVFKTWGGIMYLLHLTPVVRYSHLVRVQRAHSQPCSRVDRQGTNPLRIPSRLRMRE